MNIYATEMTVATGTMTYGGDPDDDEEKIRSREVRVSVTYRIEDPETNLAELAHAKAAEVEAARMAAQNRIDAQERIEAAGRIERDRADAEGPGFDPDDPGLVPPEADRENEIDQESEGDPECEGEEEDEEEGDEEGCIGPRYERPPCWTPPVSQGRAGTPDAETDWATKPQVLALGSLFRRLGIGPADQTALLRARYGKFRAERLTKDEAAGLMRSLERGEVELTPVATTGTTDGRRFTAPPA